MTSTIFHQGLRTLDAVHSPNFGGDLKVVALAYAIGTDVDDVLAGQATPIEATLTADGRSYRAEWHEGPESGEAIYVERHDATGCVFHGWIDQTSRKIVQAG